MLTKLGFIKFASPKNEIYERSCKLHHIPYLTTTNYLWLPSITFFRCSPIIWKPHQCAHYVLNNYLCLWIWVIHVMDQFSKWHLGWFVHKIFCIPIFTPYEICQLTHQICSEPQSCGMLFGLSSKGICSSRLAINKNQLWCNPPIALFLSWWHLAPLQTHTMMTSPLASAQLHPNCTCLCTQHLICLAENAT